MDRAFLALADPTRRAIVARLSRGPATVNELAEPFAITKQAVSRHIQVLEQAGLVSRSRDAQRRPVHLVPAALESLTAWIDGYRLDHERRFARSTRSCRRRRSSHDPPAHRLGPDGLPFVDFERELDASPAAVLRAHGEPELVARWLGPHGYGMTVETWDFRSQGAYRYVHVAPEGEFAFHGTFHTVRPDLLVQTFEYEGAPDVVAVETLAFDPLDGGARTRLRGHSTYPSVEARDAMIASGMERGITEGYERLDALLA